MSGDAFRLTWTVAAFWLAAVSAPRVLAGDTWGYALAASLTALSVGLMCVAALVAVLLLAETVYTSYRRRVLPQ